ncbi:unnamed protein product, partial [marine sediment metagenome]
MRDTRALLLETDFPPLTRGQLETLQVNLGYRCNLSCSHCHVNAGPQRTESMSLEVIELLLEFIRRRSIKQLDLTGGAPEMNPHFEYLVRQARSLDVEVIDRCNLSILRQLGYEYLAGWLGRMASKTGAPMVGVVFQINPGCQLLQQGRLGGTGLT